MPEFTVKEVRLPELHLPEINREEIVRSLSGVRIPDVDLPRVERGRRLPRLDFNALPWRKRGLSGVDVGRIIAAAITAGRLVRPATRSRWSPARLSPMRRTRRDIVAVIRPAPRSSRRGIAIVAIVGAAAALWMVFRSPSVRSRINRFADDARLRIDAMREPPEDAVDLDRGEPVSVTASSVDVTADHEEVVAEQTLVAQGAVAGEADTSVSEEPTNLT
jgi:hypothetical protein